MRPLILRFIFLCFISLSLSACSGKSKTLLQSLTVDSAVSSVKTGVSKTFKLLSPSQIKKTIQSLKVDAAKSKDVGADVNSGKDK